MNRTSLGRRYMAAVCALATLAACAAPTQIFAQASLTYMPNGRTAWGSSADGTTVFGVDNGYAFALRGGNVTFMAVDAFASYPAAVSKDGTTLVGTALDENYQPSLWVWHANDSGSTPLLPGVVATAKGISADGSTIAADETLPNLAARAFTLRNGVVTLLLYPDAETTLAYRLSANGATVVGEVHRPQTGYQPEAVVWTNGSGTAVPLVGAQYSNCWDVSQDGGTVVGNQLAGSHATGFVWRVGQATASTVDLGGNTNVSAVSADGSTAVGYGLTSANVFRGFAWRNGTLEVLAPPTGRTYSGAQSVSADGSRVVGSVWSDPPADQSEDFDNMDVVVWQDGSAQFLKDLLAAQGVSVGAARLRQPFGASGDVVTVVGETLEGGNLDGAVYGSFVAVAPLSEEPAADPAEEILKLVVKVKKSSIQPAIKTALILKLYAAFVAVEYQRPYLAACMMNSFVNHVQALRGKKIPTATADEWIADAEDIIDLLL